MCALNRFCFLADCGGDKSGPHLWPRYCIVSDIEDRSPGPSKTAWCLPRRRCVCVCFVCMYVVWGERGPHVWASMLHGCAYSLCTRIPYPILFSPFRLTAKEEERDWGEMFTVPSFILGSSFFFFLSIERFLYSCWNFYYGKSTYPLYDLSSIYFDLNAKMLLLILSPDITNAVLSDFLTAVADAFPLKQVTSS